MPPTTRPLPMRLAPAFARPWLYHRHYRRHEQSWRGLFQRAELDFARGVYMHDLVLGDVISGAIAFTGFYELELTRRVLQACRENGLLVDVGANMGYFSLLWTASVPGARAIAYEPARRNIELLRRNAERNGVASRIEIREIAVGDRRGTARFDPGPESQTGWGGLTADDGNASLEVGMTTLDDDLESQSIDVLKIDVEGADALVLRGCDRLLTQRRIRLVFFEENVARMSQLGSRAGDGAAFLRERGYTCVRLDRSANEWMAFPG